MNLQQATVLGGRYDCSQFGKAPALIVSEVADFSVTETLSTLCDHHVYKKRPTFFHFRPSPPQKGFSPQPSPKQGYAVQPPTLQSSGFHSSPSLPPPPQNIGNAEPFRQSQYANTFTRHVLPSGIQLFPTRMEREYWANVCF